MTDGVLETLDIANEKSAWHMNARLSVLIRLPFQEGPNQRNARFYGKVGCHSRETIPKRRAN